MIGRLKSLWLRERIVQTSDGRYIAQVWTGLRGWQGIEWCSASFFLWDDPRLQRRHCAVDTRSRAELLLEGRRKHLAKERAERTWRRVWP